MNQCCGYCDGIGGEKLLVVSMVTNVGYVDISGC